MSQANGDSTIGLFCSRCGGSGKITYWNALTSWQMPCDKCQGRGADVNRKIQRTAPAQRNNGGK